MKKSAPLEQNRVSQPVVDTIGKTKARTTTATRQDDPMAARFVANPYGGLNAVVEVKTLEA